MNCKIIIPFVILFLSCNSPAYKNPHVAIETKFGSIEIELFEDKAPKSVAAFLANIEDGVYKNSTFYRVLSRDNQPSDAEKTELIQGGIWRTRDKDEVNRPLVPHETTAQSKVLHKNGTLSFARLMPGTASTEFFICIGDQPSLDFGSQSNPDRQGYAAFGKVIKGMDKVRRIQNQREYDQAFDPPIHIFNIKRL